MSKLPFDRAIFWKVFAIVMAILVLTFFVLFRFTSYQLTNADRFGSLLSATIFSYLIHLWLLPPEYDDEDFEDEDDEMAAEDSGEREESGTEAGEAANSPSGDGE